MEDETLITIILLIPTLVVCFIIAYGYYKSVSKKTKNVKLFRKHEICVLIYEANHLEKAKRLLEKYNEEKAWWFPLYEKTYMAYYKGNWYTYPFKMSHQTGITLHELEEILQKQ